MATASTCGSARNASKRACSRAPEPITRTRTKRHFSRATICAVNRARRSPTIEPSGVRMCAVKRQSDDFFEQVFQFLLLRGSETPETLGELLGHRRHAAGGGFDPASSGQQ